MHISGGGSFKIARLVHHCLVSLLHYSVFVFLCCSHRGDIVRL